MSTVTILNEKARRNFRVVGEDGKDLYFVKSSIGSMTVYQGGSDQGPVVASVKFRWFSTKIEVSVPSQPSPFIMSRSDMIQKYTWPLQDPQLGEKLVTWRHTSNETGSSKLSLNNLKLTDEQGTVYATYKSDMGSLKTKATMEFRQPFEPETQMLVVVTALAYVTKRKRNAQLAASAAGGSS
jgi:hypothetical protein